jgi:hypothetical protein
MNNNLLVLGGLLVVFLTLVAMIAALAVTRIKSVLAQICNGCAKDFAPGQEKSQIGNIGQ